MSVCHGYAKVLLSLMLINSQFVYVENVTFLVCLVDAGMMLVPTGSGCGFLSLDWL